MKKIVLLAALTALAACGGSNGGASISTSVAPTSTSPTASSTTAAGSAPSGTGDTIAVANFGDMPPQCIAVLATFLKAIEPTVSTVDWTKATLADFEALGPQFQTESTAFDTQSAAAGCNKYNLTGSDADQIKQVIQLAADKAPGTVGFVTFLGSLTPGVSADAVPLPTDCNATIAEIDSYLSKGTTLKDLKMTEVSRFGELIRAIDTNCTPEQATAFAARDDITKFISG
jgi:hypothetical protein